VVTNFDTPPNPASQIIQREFRAWFVQHPDDTLNRMYWPAKVSLSIPRAKELLKKYPGGFISLTNGSLTEYLEFITPPMSPPTDSAEPTVSPSLEVNVGKTVLPAGVVPTLGAKAPSPSPASATKTSP
jgi:hypothetical protein